MNAKQIPLFEPIEIPLTRGYITLIDPIDADLAEHHWKLKFSDDRPYVHSRYSKSGPWILLHRVILERIIGRSLAEGELTDHKDNDPLNNRRSNLRIANRSQNRMNSRLERTNTSGYRGVYYNKATGRWRSALWVNGHRINIGTYDDPKTAYAAYCEFAKTYHGEFANFGITAPTTEAAE